MGHTFPDANEVMNLLGRLIGERPDLTKTKDAPSLDNAYGAICVDDQGNPIAAMVADVAASTYLAGKLLMMPIDPLRERSASGEIEEGALDALSEVFNNLTICWNDIEGNPHVRSNPAIKTSKLVETEEGSWLTSSSSAWTLSGSLMGQDGQLTIFAREG